MRKKKEYGCFRCCYFFGRCNAIYFLMFFLLAKVSAEPLSLVIGGIAAASIPLFTASYYLVKCNFFECCGSPWIVEDKNDLADTMSRQLYGQHLAQKTVVAALEAHWNNKNPKKALVLSFHGWTGSGKNYLSSMIARSIKGMDSQYVNLFISTLHFSNPHQIQEYQKNIREWIHGNVTLCERSLFIFDEIDKMPLKLMDAVKPFIDYYDNLEGVDYRKSIFIFLSNAGGNEIAQKTLKHYEAGLEREQITLKEMEEILIFGAYNSEGGFRTSELISKHLVDHFIPFLPLERRHVHLCIKDYLEEKGYEATQKRITEIAESLQYFPKSNGIFSSSGCKRVAQKTDLYISIEMETERQNYEAESQDRETEDLNDEL
uniref:Torsin n=1 Tax=Syphacia muris TaxID=451379 RepID=A0A0N5AR38_9BILA